jgi:hypothetical protein
MNGCRRRTGHLVDWAATLRKEAQRSPILRSDDLARRYGIVESAVGNALRRQERRGLVEHVSNKVYTNKLAHDFSPYELVGILRPHAYISLESALAEWGISTQSPSSLTRLNRSSNFLGANYAGVLYSVGGRIAAQCDHAIRGENDASNWLTFFPVVPTDAPMWEGRQAK